MTGTRDDLIRAYRRGATLRELAAQHSVADTTIRDWLLATGVGTRQVGPRGRVDVADEIILALRDADRLSWQEIADSVGMSRTGVRMRYAALTGQTRSR